MRDARFLAMALLLVGSAGCAATSDNSGELDAATPPGPPAPIRYLETPTGVRFGVAGPSGTGPAPTLFVFTGTIALTLGDPYYRQPGAELAEHGYLSVSLDLPSHGAARSPDEPEGLAGWRYRVDHALPLMDAWAARAKQVLDDLVARGYTDPQRVAAAGTSRGGFAAAHFAARDPRVKCIALFAPVTDLGALAEFDGAGDHPAVQALALSRQVDGLAGRGVWLVIGDQDRRVDTEAAIAFARRLSAASGKGSRVSLHVLPEPRGHTTPAGSAAHAAAWILGQMGTHGSGQAQ